MWACRETRKPEFPWVRLEIVFLQPFFYIAGGLRCLSGANRCFLGRRSVSLANYLLLEPPAVHPSIPHFLSPFISSGLS
jgi:hypothetical protein